MTLPPSLPDKGLLSVLRNWVTIVWVVIQELFVFCRAESFKQLLRQSQRLWLCCSEDLNFHSVTVSWNMHTRVSYRMFDYFGLFGVQHSLSLA